MKTKRGSCGCGRTWFNVGLVATHRGHQECVTFHQMTRSLQGGHGDCFAELMDVHLPDRRNPDQLGHAPPAQESRV